MTCALFQGTSKSKVLDHAIYQGSVTENYQSAFSYLKSHLNTEYVIKAGPREEILELPEGGTAGGPVECPGSPGLSFHL